MRGAPGTFPPAVPAGVDAPQAPRVVEEPAPPIVVDELQEAVEVPPPIVSELGARLLAAHRPEDIAGRSCPLIGDVCGAPSCAAWVQSPGASTGLCLERHSRAAAILDARRRHGAVRRPPADDERWIPLPRDPWPEGFEHPEQRTPERLAEAIGDAFRALMRRAAGAV